MPVPDALSVNVPSVQLPLTTEPEVTTRSFGISIVPTLEPPCLIVYVFKTLPDPSADVTVTAAFPALVYNSFKTPSTLVAVK